MIKVSVSRFNEEVYIYQNNHWKLNPEVFDWVRDYFLFDVGYLINNKIFDFKWNDEGCSFFFRDKEDAMMFKLRWGGK